MRRILLDIILPIFGILEFGDEGVGDSTLYHSISVLKSQVPDKRRVEGANVPAAPRCYHL